MVSKSKQIKVQNVKIPIYRQKLLKGGLSLKLTELLTHFETLLYQANFCGSVVHQCSISLVNSTNFQAFRKNHWEKRNQNRKHET